METGPGLFGPLSHLEITYLQLIELVGEMRICHSRDKNPKYQEGKPYRSKKPKLIAALASQVRRSALTASIPAKDVRVVQSVVACLGRHLRLPQTSVLDA